jgi:cellulose 1,4-beta-cellobiosidase
MGSIPVVGALGARARRGILAVVALALGSIPTFAAVNHASAAGACSVSYVVTNQWSTGFTVQGIQITNLGPAINGWTLTFSFPGTQTIAAGPWNGTFTQTGSQVTVTNLSYNGSIPTNGSVNPAPGFNGVLTGTNPPPTSFSLNGTVCNGGTPTPTPTTSGTPTPTPSGTPNPTPTPTATPTATPTPTPTGTPTPTPTPTNCNCPHPQNPYPGANFYLNPNYQAEVQAQATADNSTAEAKVATWQTAIWMDHIGAIAGDSTHMGLQAQLDNAVSKAVAGTPELVEIVIYDLPGRDCAALASNGEIPATAAGLTEYEQQYIMPIAAIEGNAKYANLRMVNVIEPDSLPNAVTNTSKPTCSTAAPFYEQGIEFALNQLKAIGNQVWTFLDIAHSAWLGWPNNTQLAGPEYLKVVKATTLGFGSIDGFISDTANYTPTVEPFLPTTNPTMQIGGQAVNSVPFYQFNVTFDENTYDLNMYNELVSQGFPATIGFLIDTSRNGWGGPARPAAQNNTPTTAAAFVAANKIDQRVFRGNWCNQNGAGIGAIPQANPAGVNSHIFAYVWVKPPGESDGDFPSSTHTHGDPHCDPNSTNTDGNGNTFPTGSIPGFDIPAGQFFPAQFQQLVSNSFPKIQ